MAGRSRPMELDQKLSNWVAPHFNVNYDDDRFGIEIELEGHKVQAPENPELHTYWKQTKDGSLRPRPDCVEYLSRYPLKLDETKKSLELLIKYLTKTPGVKVLPSYRTSIHVHVNCMNLTLRHLANYITLAIIFDELLVSQNGQTRVGNNFCLRTRDAEGQIGDLINSIKTYGSLHHLDHTHRYSSTNLCSIGKYGTIEFRSLECTTDFDRIWHWVNTLQSLKEAARKFDNPREIIGKFSQKGSLGFIMSMLGDQGLKYVEVPGYAEMLRHGMRLAQDFAYCSDWKAYEGKPLAAKPKKKYVNAHPAGWGMDDFEQIYMPQPAIGLGGDIGLGGWAQAVQAAPQPHVHDAQMEEYLNAGNAWHIAPAQPAPVQAVPFPDDIEPDDMDYPEPVEEDHDDEDDDF